jgi:hypothetical protein
MKDDRLKPLRPQERILLFANWTPILSFQVYARSEQI